MLFIMSEIRCLGYQLLIFSKNKQEKEKSEGQGKLTFCINKISLVMVSEDSVCPKVCNSSSR